MTPTTPTTQLPPAPAPVNRDTASVLRAAALRFTVLRAKIRVAVWTETAAWLVTALLVYALTTFLADRTLRLETVARALLLASFVAFALRTAWQKLVLPMRARLDDDELALAVERQVPGIQQALISSMQFERALGGPRRGADSPELMRVVVRDVESRVSSMPFADALDGKRMARCTTIVSAVAAAFLLWGIAFGPQLRLWAMRNLFLSSEEWPRYTQLAFADGEGGGEGGVRRLPQGDALTVVVRATGVLPEEVHLRSRFASGETAYEPMSRTGEGEFSLTIETLLENATLVAEGGDGISSPLSIEIVERPRVEGVAVQIVFPDYMQKEPEDVPPTEGELRIVRGSEIRVAAASHKPVTQAFLLLGDERHDLAVADGALAFSGSLKPQQSGLLTIDVIDRDQLGAGSPPKLFVRLVEDKPPTLEWKLRGIGPLVTPQVRIPGQFDCKDDFGITHVAAEFRAMVDTPPAKESQESGAAPLVQPEAPFVPIDVAWQEALQKGAIRYQTAGIVDILPRNPKPQQEDDLANEVRPGMLLSLRFSAKDNFGPGSPHEHKSEAFTFRVVTREKLVDELRRRQVEQRQEVEKIRDEEAAALADLRERVNPKSDNPLAARDRLSLKQLAARQQALARRTTFAADLYQRILWEYENNRVLEPTKVREFEGLTSVPLLQLGKATFPDTAHAVATYADTGDEQLKNAAVDGYNEILRRLEAILRVMENVETLAAIIEQLRGVIKVEDSAIREVENRIQAAGESLFDKPGKDQQKK